MRRFSKLLSMGLMTGALAFAAGAQAASSPTVSVASPTSITNSSATVRATIRPGGAQTFYVVQSGLTTGYGLNSTAKSVSGSRSSAAVSVKLAGLLPGTVYHYRFVLISKYGSTTSADHQVKTGGSPPPDVATGAAQLDTPNIVTLAGVINPHNATTTYFFQYGQNSLPLTLDTQTIPKSIPSGGGPRVVQTLVAGLAANTTYHFQLLAVHAGGSPPTSGGLQTFTTYPAPRPRPVIHSSVSPRRAAHRPYAFAVFGSLRESQFPTSLECSGNIEAKFQLGRRVIDTELTAVSPSCQFSEVAIFHRLPGRGKRNRHVILKVTVTFRGNHYLFPVSAKPIRIRLG